MVSHFVILGTKGRAFSAFSSNPFHTWSRLRAGTSGSLLSLTGTDRVMVNTVLTPFISYYSAQAACRDCNEHTGWGTAFGNGHENRLNREVPAFYAWEVVTPSLF